MEKTYLLVETKGEKPLVFEITASDKGLAVIDCLETVPKATKFARSAKDVSHPVLKQTVRELIEYFAGKRREFSVPLDLQFGTEFQREVWDELKRIPYGQTISYGQQAKNIGRPGAMRAVGGANGRNPVPIVIPCHRVLSSTGKLHGFSSGLDLKRRLLAVEGLDVRK